MSSPVIRRHTYGRVLSPGRVFIGIATSRPVSPERRADYVRIVRRGVAVEGGIVGYGAVLTDLSETELEQSHRSDESVVICDAEHLEHIADGDVLRLESQKGLTRSLYRSGSRHNIIFATDRCNSNCLMCSQPPKDVDDGYLVAENLRLIDLIPPTTRDLTITGGEPTLLGQGLWQLLEACQLRV